MFKSVGCSRRILVPSIVVLVLGVSSSSGYCQGAGGGEYVQPPIEMPNKLILQGALLGAGVSLVVAGFIVDDREPQRVKYRDDLGNWENLTLFPVEQSGLGDQKAFWVAGTICLGFALIVELGDRFGSGEVDSPQKAYTLGSTSLHLESTWLDNGVPGVGLAACF